MTIKLSIRLCAATSLLAWSVSACDSGTSSEPTPGISLDGNGGAGNSDQSAAGASGDGNAMDSTAECERLSRVQCKQFYDCFSAQVLAQIADMVGTTEADCVAMFSQTQCANTGCPAGETYMPASSDQCVNNFAALSCAQFAAIANRTAQNPPGCDSICK